MRIPYTDISHHRMFIYLPIILTIVASLLCRNIIVTTGVFIVTNVLALCISKINCAYYIECNKIYIELDSVVTELENNNIYMVDDRNDIYSSIIAWDIIDHIRLAERQLQQARRYINSYAVYTMLNVEDMQDSAIIQFRTNFITCIAKLYEIIDSADNTRLFIQAVLNTCEYVKKYGINYDIDSNEYEGFVNSLIKLYLQYYTLIHGPVPTVSASIVS